ncbi:hypothetical protein [Streptomyces sp. NPDC127190]|uniref:hypothetical protein n=1 Tax=unclassified Streptomyces TaxID=2593676 RepID=UPI00363297A1
MSASPAVRALRAAVFAAVCVLLAVAGHGLAMGDLPPLGADAAAFGAVFGLGWTLGGRERSLPGIGAAMLLTQAGLHLGFDAAHRGTGATPMAPMHAHTAVAHATAAHLLAALAASWWLWRGEAALWSLLRRAGTLLPGLVAWWRDAPLPTARGPVLRAFAGPGPLRRLRLRHTVHRRGPPAPIPYPV